MKSRYYFALAAALVSLPLAFTACGDGATDSSEDTFGYDAGDESNSRLTESSSSFEKSSSSRTKDPMDDHAVWCVVNKDTVVVGQNVTWSLTGCESISGAIDWIIVGSVNDIKEARSTDSSRTASLGSAGFMTASVAIYEKDDVTIKVHCPKVTVVEAPDSVDVDKLNGLGTCAPVENEVAVNDTVSWKFSPNVQASGYNASDFVTASYEWQLDSAASQLNSTGSFISTSYGAAGEHKASLVVTMKDGLVDTLSCAPVNIVESAPAP